MMVVALMFVAVLDDTLRLKLARLVAEFERVSGAVESQAGRTHR
jgi:hypothetical protein